MENEVDAVALLSWCSFVSEAVSDIAELAESYFCGKGHASADDQVLRRHTRGHHAELLLLDKRNEILDLCCKSRLILVLGHIGVGGLVGWSVCVAESGRHLAGLVEICDCSTWIVSRP